MEWARQTESLQSDNPSVGGGQESQQGGICMRKGCSHPSVPQLTLLESEAKGGKGNPCRCPHPIKHCMSPAPLCLPIPSPEARPEEAILCGALAFVRLGGAASAGGRQDRKPSRGRKEVRKRQTGSWPHSHPALPAFKRATWCFQKYLQ